MSTFKIIFFFLLFLAFFNVILFSIAYYKFCKREKLIKRYRRFLLNAIPGFRYSMDEHFTEKELKNLCSWKYVKIEDGKYKDLLDHACKN